MGEEKTVKPQNKAEDKEFIARLTEFIRTRRPTKTSDFVKAGLFKDRGEARKVLRALAEKNVIRMEKGANHRYHYGLFGQPLILPKKLSLKLKPTKSQRKKLKAASSQ